MTNKDGSGKGQMAAWKVSLSRPFPAITIPSIARSHKSVAFPTLFTNRILTIHALPRPAKFQQNTKSAVATTKTSPAPRTSLQKALPKPNPTRKRRPKPKRTETKTKRKRQKRKRSRKRIAPRRRLERKPRASPRLPRRRRKRRRRRLRARGRVRGWAVSAASRIMMRIRMRRRRRRSLRRRVRLRRSRRVDSCLCFEHVDCQDVLMAPSMYTWFWHCGLGLAIPF